MKRNRDILGIPAPALDVKPEIYSDLIDVYYSFHVLNRCRGYTDMGMPKPVQLSDIKLIYDEFDLSPLFSFRAYLNCIIRLCNTVDALRQPKAKP